MMRSFNYEFSSDDMYEFWIDADTILDVVDRMNKNDRFDEEDIGDTYILTISRDINGTISATKELCL